MFASSVETECLFPKQGDLKCWIVVTGDQPNCSISSIILGGYGTIRGVTIKGNLLIVSALPCTLKQLCIHTWLKLMPTLVF